MKTSADPLVASVEAIRDLTAAPADGRATRARVLIALTKRDGRPATGKRAGLAMVAFFILSSAALASRAMKGHWWRSSAVTEHPLRPKIAAVTDLPAAIQPRPIVMPAASPTTNEDERRLYGRAHQTHFGGVPVLRALDAWNEYLRLFPEGTLAPEARFNRAVCLFRLRRFRGATQALRPFARGQYEDYRRQEACLLLERMTEERGATIKFEPACRNQR